MPPTPRTQTFIAHDSVLRSAFRQLQRMIWVGCLATLLWDAQASSYRRGTAIRRAESRAEQARLTGEIRADLPHQPLVRSGDAIGYRFQPRLDPGVAREASTRAEAARGARPVGYSMWRLHLDGTGRSRWHRVHWW